MPIAALLLALIQPAALPRPPLDYSIEVQLDPATGALTGHETVRLSDFTDEPLTAVPLHLYLNGFASDRSSWMVDGMEADELDRHLRVFPDSWGSIEITSINQVVDEKPKAVTVAPIQPDDGNPFDRSLVLATLPEPVPPGGSLLLDITFKARLPVPFARTGGRDDFFLGAQFYPKPGVLEPAGLHGRARAGFAAAQFHGPTEFYADFADYQVTVDVPMGFTVAATGSGSPPVFKGGRVRRTFRAQAVHDFAFVAGSHLDEHVERVAPVGGSQVELHLVAPTGSDVDVERARAALLPALDELSSTVGPYPYETLTVVLPPFSAVATGGMEYPTFLTAFFADPLLHHVPGFRLPEQILVHELAHQWFYGMLASDEVSSAYLDEGFTAYWDGKLGELAAPGASLGRIWGRSGGAFDRRKMRLAAVADRIREPILRSPSWLYAPGTGQVQIYDRTALTLRTAEGFFGEAAMNRMFRDYFRASAFQHPGLEDFLRAASLLPGVPGMLPFLEEAFRRPDVPDFQVQAADSWPLRAARGNAPQVDAVSATTAFVSGPGGTEAGRVERMTLPADQVAPEPGMAGVEGPFESRVTVTGPDWRNLPVEVELRFADGTVLTDRWDGRGDYRTYRLVTPSPLVDAVVDRPGRVALDPRPQNNGLTTRPSSPFLADVSVWSGALAAWLSAAVTAWL